MTTRVVLYDLAGKPQELEGVESVYTYESHVCVTVRKGEELENVLVGWHRVHEIRFEVEVTE